MSRFPTAESLLEPRCLEDLLLYRLSRVVRAGSSMATRLVEGGFGITRREWAMIGVLSQIGETTPSQLAERLQLDRVRTSRGLRSLVEKKLVERRKLIEDRREVHVRLSDSGRRLFGELFPRIAGLNRDLLDGVSVEHIDVLLQCLHRLELRGQELDALGIVTDKANRRAGGTRHRWPEPASHLGVPAFEAPKPVEQRRRDSGR